VTGRRRQAWHSGYRTKREAERALTDLLGSRDRGDYVERSRQPLGDYLDEWLVAIESTVRESTLYSYRRNLRLHVRPYLAGVPLTKVDGGALNKVYSSLLASGRRDGRPGQTGLSPRSVRYVHTILHRAFKDAVRWGRLTRNPCDAADPPRYGAADHTVAGTWSGEALRSFLDESGRTGDRYFAAWLFLATTGCRRGEALGLRWTDVNLDDRRAEIVQTVTVVNHQPRIGPPKTASGRRGLALDAATVEALRSWRARQLEERLLLGAGYRDHDLVFSKIDGDVLHPERFSREFDRRVARWGLPRLTVHGLRHTWATAALRAGVHPRVVQERLGHSTVAVTLSVYSHVGPTLHDEAASLVASQLLGDRLQTGSTVAE
jgi:integrase